MSTEQLPEVNEKAVELALDPEAGTPFEYGGRQFKFQYLTADGQNRLSALTEPHLKTLILEGKHEDPRNVFNALRPILTECMFVILNDYDPSVTPEWVKSRRGKGVKPQRQYAIVSQQFEVDEVGKLVYDNLGIDALLSAPRGQE